MTNLTREQFHSAIWHRPDPKPEKEKKQRHNLQVFWAVCVPGGAVISGFITLLSGAGGAFFPCWAVVSIVLWGVLARD